MATFSFLRRSTAPSVLASLATTTGSATATTDRNTSSLWKNSEQDETSLVLVNRTRAAKFDGAKPASFPSHFDFVATGTSNSSSISPWSKSVAHPSTDTSSQGGIVSLLNANKTYCDDSTENPMTMASLDQYDTTIDDPTSAVAAAAGAWRKRLPHPLNTRTWLQRETIVTKTKEEDGEEDEHITEIFLLGTHHYSNASVKATTLLLESVQPDTILVELCPERVAGLTAKRRPPRIPLFSSFIQFVWTCGLSVGEGLHLALFGHIYSRLCKEYGGEFRASYDYVKSQPKDKRPMLLLGDRPSSITHARLEGLESNHEMTTESEATRWTLASLYGNETALLITQDEEGETQAYDQLYRAWQEQSSFRDFLIEGVIENDNLAVILKPQVTEPPMTDRIRLQERDVYMVCKLVQTCRVTKPKRIVAVVGAAHLRGMPHLIRTRIIENGSLGEPEEILAELLTTERASLDNARLQEISRELGYIELTD